MRPFNLDDALQATICWWGSYTTAWACESAPPAMVWVQSNDHNQDGHLDFSEWQQASANGFKLAFTPGSKVVFQALDHNLG